MTSSDAEHTALLLSEPASEYSLFLSSLSDKDKQFLGLVSSNADFVYKYQSPLSHDLALESIDLEKIYEGVERREQEQEEQGDKPDKEKLDFQDHVVVELLHFFRHSFFKWVNKPQCPNCKSDENIQGIGVTGGPPASQNPDQVGRIEVYKCTKCGKQVTFPRINNPVSLLRTKEGRCGEWVNCFMLLLQATLGADVQIRYIVNYEDHVWCEYYSTNLKRWVHLDPCEDAFDNPTLYCENWGKSMSWVFGFGLGYAVDLSDKYITKPDKQLDKWTMVSHPLVVRKYLEYTNNQLLKKYYTERLNDIQDEASRLLALSEEVVQLKENELNALPSKSTSQNNVPKGRQSGSAEWTKTRGEAGE